MRDLIAGLVAFGLFLFALGLASTLRHHRRSRERERHELLATGRTVIAEIPTENGLTLFIGDKDHFRWGEATIAKNDIQLVKVLINGSPIASYNASQFPLTDPENTKLLADRPEGIAHDRWDVLVKTESADTLIECGSIRERVSQELARRVFDAVKADMKYRNDLMEQDDRLPPTTTTPAL